MTVFMVNLLPWRQRRLVRRSRYWCLLLLCHTGCVLMVIAGGKQVTSRQRLVQEAALTTALQQQQQRHTQLQDVRQAMTQLRQQQEGRQAQGEAQAHILRYVQLLEQLSGLVPDELWLTSLADQGDGISISGRSHNYTDIVQFSMRLERLASLTAVRIVHAQIVHAQQERALALPVEEISPLVFQLQADWRGDPKARDQHE